MGPLIPSSPTADGPGRIIWLASYPKSGNTWMRMVLGQLLEQRMPGTDINNLALKDGVSDSRLEFDDIVGVNAGDLSHDQVDNLRPRVFEHLSREAKRTLFVKVHDAYQLTSRGDPLFPRAATRGVVHIVRNPLDVAVSLAHYLNTSADKAVAILCDAAFAWYQQTDTQCEKLRLQISDWSGHAEGWLSAPLPRLTLSYEDMLAAPDATFARVARFCGIEVQEADLQQALEACRFTRLQALESQQRFAETPRGARRFFRSGKSGDWRQSLSQAQARRIVESQGAMMARLGYGELVREVLDLP